MNNALLPPTIIGHTSTCQNGQEDVYFERPKKRGNPSHAVWNRMAEIIKDSIGSISPNADFNEIAHTIEDWARFYDITLPQWAVSKFTNQILDLYCCLNYLCQLKTSEYVTLHDIFAASENKVLLLSFNPSQFKELTYREQIDFLLSHASLVKKVMEIINNQNK